MDFAVSPPGGHHKKFRATGSMTSRAKMAKIGFSKAPSTKIKTRSRIKCKDECSGNLRSPGVRLNLHYSSAEGKKIARHTAEGSRK